MTAYNRFDPAKGYVAHLFHADRVAQSAEVNEIQSASQHRLRRIADVLFADGDITDGARCTVDADTGACALEAGGIYIAGAVHTVAAAALVVPVVGAVAVGVYYLQRVVTAVQDPSLYNPAINTAGYGEPGADRLQVTTTWGVQSDGTPGDFYPVWAIEDGVGKPREPAPTLNAVTAAIARYDIDSAGGTYVVRGLNTLQLPDADGAQVYAITAGAARVNGASIELPVDRRLVYAAAPNTALVSSEPHGSTTEGLQHVPFDRWPVLLPAQVRIQKRKSDPITHGGFVGAADPLPEGSVVQINTITQGGTTYIKDVDYKLTAGQVDWSLSGAEPTPGSTYQATYEFISTEGVQNQTPRGFDVEGALPGTLILVDYSYALRRIDRIVMGADGVLNVIKGIPATWQPVPPDVPATVLALASLYQTWDAATRTTTVDSVRTVPMDKLVAYETRMDGIELDLAELRLATDVNGRFGGLKKGYFADPMLDNSMRDQGLPQTALIADRALQLHEAQTAHLLGDGKTAHTLDYTLVPGVTQASYSRSMTVNDSPIAGELPASVTLTPAADRWEVPGVQAYPKRVTVFYAQKTGRSAPVIDSSLVNTAGITLREIEVQFSLSSFKALEALQSLTFDGQTIALASITGTKVANAAGVMTGAFTVPAGLPTGTKTVEFTGANGSSGTASYTGSASLTLNVKYSSYSYWGDIGAGNMKVTYVL